MSFSLLLTNITDAIASISISGVSVKDYDQVAAGWTQTPYVLYLNPDPEPITNFRIEYPSLLQGDGAPMNVSYVLHYRFLALMVGDMATFTKSFTTLVDKGVAIVNAMAVVSAPYSGRVEMRIAEDGLHFGPKHDPAGNQYFGADILLSITEMQD